MILSKKKDLNQSKKTDAEKKENQKKNKIKKNTKKIAHIKDAIPATWSDEYQCFIDDEDNFILMAKVQGINIWGLNQNDLYTYLNAFAAIFLQNIKSGIIHMKFQRMLKDTFEIMRY